MPRSRNGRIEFLNPTDIVANPYKTASLVARVNDEFLIFSAIGGWNDQTGELLEDPGERASQSYYNIWRIARAVGADQEDIYRILVYARPDPESGNRLFNLYRDRLTRETIEQYGGALLGSPPFSGQSMVLTNGTVATNNDNLAVPAGFKFPTRIYSGLLEGQATGTVSAIAEAYIKGNKPHDGQRHFQLENPPYNLIYPIAAPISHISIEGDFARTTGTRAYRKRVPGTGQFPAATWFEWVQLTDAEAGERVNVTWYDHIREKGNWIQADFSRLYRVAIAWVPVGDTDAVPKTEAVFRNLYGPTGPYPVLEFTQAPATGPGDSYEVIPDWYLGARRLRFNTSNVPYAAKGPYSNAVRAGDYVFTSLLSHFDANGVPAGATPYERATIAYRNMLAAARVLGARLRDLYKITVYVTRPIAEYAEAVDQVSYDLFGRDGPFPPRAFSHEDAIVYGGEISVSGAFYAPRRRRGCRDRCGRAEARVEEVSDSESA